MFLSKFWTSKKKSKKREVAIKATQERPVPAPINALPTEILAYIFECLLDSHAQSCFMDMGGQDGGKSLRPPDYPESLLRVCGYWRQVVLASPTLWTHIDVFLPVSNSRQTLPRAKAFLKRAGRSPVSIHIFDKPRRPWRIYDQPDDEYSNLEVYLTTGLTFGLPDEDEDMVRDDPEALEFILSIPARASVKSIELVMTSDDMPRIFGPVLRQFFGGCVPGTLTKFTSKGKDFLPFIDPEASRATRRSINVLFPPTEKLEALWLSITTLHISGAACLPWRSNIFKGLTDLRLGACHTISEPHFVDILKSSPKLRILQFHIHITGALPLNAVVEPIHLGDLEVLDLIEKRLDGPKFEAFIRWIELGQKPLRLSIWCPIGDEMVKKFFRRSNVTELHARIDGTKDINIAQLETIIGLSPGLRVLAIDACDHHFLSKNAFYGEGSSSCSPVRIDTLHLQHCQSIQIEKLHWMIKKYSIQTLRMWSSTVLEGHHVARDSDLSSLCPSVKRLKRREYTPMENWIESIV